ncbi:MAG: hypothetical protein L0332_19175, partial [Chloroflexi bacterium]|nr:hypothetical protein [Chloroflexota bacterium]MCI0728819.1 hypothetical protein [Chloroflexota bacterium]
MKRLMLLLLVLLGFLVPRPALAANCSVTSVGLTPLNDLAGGNYQGFPGGLYPGGNAVPAAHLQVGLAAGQAVQRLNPQGAPSPNGKIIVLSIGMSNTKQEFAKFTSIARGQTAPGVVLINGAQPNYDASIISNPNSDYWPQLDDGLARRRLSPLQVQVVWLKEAVQNESDPFPASAIELQGYLKNILQIVRTRYPNVKAIYLSSRTYGGYANNPTSPEPWAYQGAFAVKWLIEAQITGSDPALSYDNAPWLAWGPYFWADGLTPRSDGLTWACADFSADGVHPSAAGQLKAAN